MRLTKITNQEGKVALIDCEQIVSINEWDDKTSIADIDPGPWSIISLRGGRFAQIIKGSPMQVAQDLSLSIIDPKDQF